MSSFLFSSEKLKRKTTSDLDDNFQAQKRYISERMANEIAILKISSDRPAISTFRTFNPFLRDKFTEQTFNLSSLNLELDSHKSSSAPCSPTTNKNRTSRKFKQRSNQRTQTYEKEEVDREKQEQESSEVILNMFSPNNSKTTSQQISTALEMSKPFYEKSTSPFVDLAISSPSRALILYQPPEKLLLSKSVHPNQLADNILQMLMDTQDEGNRANTTSEQPNSQLRDMMVEGISVQSL